MGSLCSKSSSLSGGHRLVSEDGGQPVAQERPDPRAAAAEAAEQRLKASQQRGVVASNPNRGRLASQLEANKAAAKVPAEREQERLVWD